MKKFVVIVSSIFMAVAVQAGGQNQQPSQREVQVGLNGVYVPGGFDSGSDAYVVVSGIFQNGCYRWGRAEVTNKTNFEHEIKSIARVTQGMCLMVLIPFQKDVRLGKLESGNHKLIFDNGDGTYIEKTLTVE